MGDVQSDEDLMSARDLSPADRTADYFHHIDPGFLNRRLALSALPVALRQEVLDRMRPQHLDHMARLANIHTLVTVLLDFYDAAGAPSLLQALAQGKPRLVFRSVEKLAACPEVYKAPRVAQQILLNVDFGKPVIAKYHTSHICSDTGRMTLADGLENGNVEAMLGLLHDRGDHYEVEPIVMGAPTLDHWWNSGTELMWLGWNHAEILAEDIAEFARMTTVEIADAREWMEVMRATPEERVKQAFAPS